MGRDRFTPPEIAAIRELLQALQDAPRDEQRRLRDRLRREFRFFVTDFAKDRPSLTPADLDELIRSARVRVTDEVPPPSAPHAGRGEAERWRPEPNELVAVALAGPGRDDCVRLCAAALREAERLDLTRTAVTPIKVGSRFRVIGGLYQGVAPWQDLLGVAVPAGAKGLHAEVERCGGRIIDQPPASVPSSLTVGVPRRAVGVLYDDLLESHTKHLPASI